MGEIEHDLPRMVDKILQSPKYRSFGIPRETVIELLRREFDKKRTKKEAVKITRQKLHNIIAPYLGDPDYQQAGEALLKAYQDGGDPSLKEVCVHLLEAHASTRERIPILSEFYKQIFTFTGQPDIILDLACGMHPFGFPWMGLPVSTRYYAYDIHQPRIDLINDFFNLLGMRSLAFAHDILIRPPTVRADVALIFKEAHRFEQRRRGANLPLWKALNVRYLLISLPTSSLSGKHDLTERQRNLVYGILGDMPWRISELEFENEIVFCVEKDEEE
jgi:16S rRNA (guanine(1405)-N(7))-methyltransferase